MKARVSKRWLSIAMSVCLLAGLIGDPVLANSAQTHWEGISATGTVVVDENCPIEVEKEVLTFDVQEFPQGYYRELEPYLAYTGKVTAEYTFYNPSDYTVTAKLLFPFGNEPTYRYDYDYDTEKSYYNVDTEKFDITVNGEPIEKNLRYTFSERWVPFVLKRDLALLYDDYREDAFYSPDLLVTKYDYEITDVDTKTYQAASVAVDVKTNDDTRKVYFVEQSGAHGQGDKTMRLSHWAETGKTLTVYVLGEPFEHALEWQFYEDGGVANEEKIPGTVTLLGTKTMTFRDPALEKWTEESGVSEIDWYNAVVAMMREMGGSVLHLYSGEMGLDMTYQLMRWYEYEIQLEPGERIVNAVTAPLYPEINQGYEPPVYGYQYLLSPAKTWAAFGELDIQIRTPFFLTECNMEGFEKTETGYRLVRDGLPEGELSFSLSASEKPKRQNNGLAYLIYPMVWLLEIVAFIGVVMVAVTLIKKLWRKR